MSRKPDAVDVTALLSQLFETGADLPAGFTRTLHTRLSREPPPRRPLATRIMNLLEQMRLDSGPRLGLCTAALAALLVLAPRTFHPATPVAGEVVAPFQVPSHRVAVVHLDFITDVEVKNVEFEVTLPTGLAFIDSQDGRPIPDRRLRWSGSLQAGSNPIPLPVRGTKPGRYTITALARGEDVAVQHDVVLEVVSS